MVTKSSGKGIEEFCASCYKKLKSKKVKKDDLVFCCPKCCDDYTEKKKKRMCEFC